MTKIDLNAKNSATEKERVSVELYHAIELKELKTKM